MIQELFAECLQVKENEWERVLLAKCPDDADVRNQVLELLRADAANQQGDFLPDHPALNRPDKNELTGIRKQLGRFRLLRKIGEGSSGIVYEACLAVQQPTGDPSADQGGADQGQLDRCSSESAERFAVKVLHPWLRDENSFARFAAEARALRSLDHPHIAKFVEAGSEGDIRYLVMEYIGGECLSERLKNGAGKYEVGKIPLDLRIRWFQMICEGVAAAHQQLLLHRDLKPSNVLIDTEGNAVVTDFGLVKFLEPKILDQSDDRLSGLTSTGQTPGTLLFMAPEQMDGSGQLRLATDVYGLGATLYFLLTGRTPYMGRSAVELCDAIRTGPPIPIHTFDPSTPKDLHAICVKCLNAKPERRYQTAQALEEDISRYLAGEPISARQIGYLETATYWLYRSPVQALLVIGLVLSILLGLALTSIFWVKAERNYAQAEASKSDLLQTISEVTTHLKSVEHDPKTLPLQREMLLSIAQGYDRLATYTELSPRHENNRGVAWFKLGRAEHQLGDKEAKRQAYANAEKIFCGQLEKDPENVEWAFDHFHALTSLRRSEEALKAIERVIDLDQTENLSYLDAYSNSLLEFAREKMFANQLEKAAELADRGLRLSATHHKRYPDDQRFLRKLAQHHYLQYQLATRNRMLDSMVKHLSEAVRLIERAEEKDRRDAGVRIEVIRYRLMMARLESMRGNHDQAQEHFVFSDRESNEFFAEFPTYTDAWICRADSLRWQVAHYWSVGNQDQLARVRREYEQLLMERLKDRHNCHLANARLAMLIASPTLQDVPDLKRGAELLEIAKQDSFAAALGYPNSILKIWSGNLEALGTEDGYAPILRFYIEAIENSEVKSVEMVAPQLLETVDADMLFEFLSYYEFLIPHGFHRDVAFAIEMRKERTLGHVNHEN